MKHAVVGEGEGGAMLKCRTREVNRSARAKNEIKRENSKRKDTHTSNAGHFGTRRGKNNDGRCEPVPL